MVAFSAMALAQAATARAAEHDFSAAGQGVAIVSPCPARVTIETDPSLDGSVRVAATAAHAEEIGQLAVAAKSGAMSVDRADPSRQCWRPDGDTSFSPTLALAVRVPFRAAVVIDDAGEATYALGAVGGPLAAEISGAATLGALRVTSLDLDLSGRARIAVAAQRGPAVVRSSGRAEVRIDRAGAPTFRIEMSGAGTVSVGSGTVGSLFIDSSGAARVDIGGTTGDAILSLSGAGGVRIAHLTGVLRKDSSGVAAVAVGR